MVIEVPERKGGFCGQSSWKVHNGMSWVGYKIDSSLFFAKPMEIFRLCTKFDPFLQLEIGSGARTSFWHDKCVGERSLKEAFFLSFFGERHWKGDVCIADFMQQNGSVFDGICTSEAQLEILMEETNTLLQLLSSVSVDQETGTWDYRFLGNKYLSLWFCSWDLL